MKQLRLGTFIAGLILTAWLGVAAAQTPATLDEPLRASETAVSKPSLRLQLQFFAAGIVQEWMVKPGDMVKTGQVLMTQDQRLLRKELEKLDLEAQSTHQIDAAKAQLAVSEVVYERKMESANAFSQSELDEAKLQVDIGRIRVKLADLERAKALFDSESARIRLDMMELKSPIDGQVVALGIGPGEMADPNNQRGAAEVVQNSPLWVELVLPLRQAALLRQGDKLVCKHPDGVEAPGTVVFFSPVAQADTQLVRLEVPNTELRASGQPVTVSLPTEPASRP